MVLNIADFFEIKYFLLKSNGKLNKLTDIDDSDEDSFKIMNYDHYNTIPASMIA